MLLILQLRNGCLQLSSLNFKDGWLFFVSKDSLGSSPVAVITHSAMTAHILHDIKIYRKQVTQGQLHANGYHIPSILSVSSICHLN